MGQEHPTTIICRRCERHAAVVDAHAEHPVLVERERDEALVDAATYRQMLQHALGQLHSLTSKHRQVCAQRDRLRDQLRDVPHREAA